MGGLIAGLLGGAASAFGQHEDEAHAHKQALSDEEHEQQLADKNATIKTIQDKMAAAGPDHPEYAGLQNQLNQVIQDRTALFHPDAPGGLERLGKKLWESVHGPIKPQMQTDATASTPGTTAMPTAGTMGQPGPTGAAIPGVNVTHPATTPAEFKARAAQDLGYGAPAPPPNPHQVFRDQLKQALPNMSDEDLDNAVQIHAGVAAKPVADKPEIWTSRGAPIKDAEGNWVQPQFNKAGEARNQPMAPGYEAATKTPTANAAVQRAEYAKSIGKDVADLTFEDEQNMIRLVKQAGAPTTTSGRYAFVPQKDGSTKAVWTESTSSKNFGGKQPTKEPNATQPTVPKTAGDAKKAAKAAAPKAAAKNSSTGETASVARAGATVGGKPLPAENVARKNRDAAYNSFLDVQKAAADPTPVGDQGVILSWLRGRVNRVTATEIAAVNNLGGAEMKLEGNIVRIASGRMTDQQRQWFLKSAKDNYDNANTVLGQYDNHPDDSDDDKFLRGLSH